LNNASTTCFSNETRTIEPFSVFFSNIVLKRVKGNIIPKILREKAITLFNENGY